MIEGARRTVEQDRPWAVLLRSAMVPVMAVGLAATVIAAFVSPAHAVGAAVGTVLAAVAFAAGPLILAMARNWAPPAVMAAALGGYLTLIGVLAVIYLVLLPADWMAHVATGWTLLACASASIAGQIRAMSRLRVLAFGSPVPPSGDTTTGHQMPERAGETSDDPSGRRPIGGA
ncbi:MAG: hypothetical protein U0Q19_13725 [Kineosporiaceae bacterium]